MPILGIMASQISGHLVAPILGTTWTAGGSLPRTGDWICSAAGNGMVVAFDGNSLATYASSPTGATWTSRSITTGAYNSVGYGNGVFLVFENVGPTQTSTTGTSFTAATSTALGGSIIYSCGYYLNNWLAIRASATSASISANNGSTWTAKTLSNSVYAITASPTRAVGVKNGTTNTSYSSDLTTWTTGSMPSSSTWTGVGYGNGVFFATSSVAGVGGASSTDGISWTSRTLPSSTTWFKVLWAGSNFIVFTQGGTVCATSTDGISWTSRTIGNAWWFSGGVINNSVVMVAYNASTASQISTS